MYYLFIYLFGDYGGSVNYKWRNSKCLLKFNLMTECFTNYSLHMNNKLTKS